MPRRTVNIAVLTPMPNASVSMATVAKTVARRRELLLTGGGEGVDAHALAVLRGAPRGGQPFLFREAVEGGIERPRFHLQHVVGIGADHLRDAVAVARPPAQGLENDEVERALE